MTLMAHTSTRSTDSGFSSGFMPTPNASPKQGFSNLVDNIDFGDEQRGLLDELDKLREHGVDKYVELPQIVVVGDQSSGKSSVLEAISELPFPRSSIRCTRFATQIKLRHSLETSLKVGIIPDPKRTPQERQRLAQFPSTFPPNTPFRDIMDLATKYIVPDNKASFCSKDVFSIEMSGPTKPHLTIVDLPGLIQAANNHQTQADVDSIKELAYDYMKNQRTIILAIVSAASDLELQPVLAREARQFDPTGARTLGIITKPDKTETPEREAQFLELARNENIKFKLGWHVLRNRAPNEMDATSEERKRTEKKFFQSTSWSQLGPDKFGIETLRTKLSQELIKHIIHEMPAVQAEIRSKLDEVRRQLDQLGERGTTPDEMRDELRDLMEKSQALTRSAMEGQYVDLYGPAFFHPTPQSPMEAVRKLRARLVIQNEGFAAEMSSLGHLVELSDEPAGSPGGPGFQDSHHPKRMTRGEFIRRHVEPLLEASPGLELRMDKNPLLVYTLFRNYSQNWPDIATRHLEEVQAICNDFLQEIIDFAWPVDMRPRAWNNFIEDKMEGRLSEAHKEASKLFKDRTRAAKPYDPEHTAKVLDWLARKQQAPTTSSLLSEFAPDVFLQKMLVYYEVSYDIL
jgi:GTPase SAR1 family protein